MSEYQNHRSATAARVLSGVAMIAGLAVVVGLAGACGFRDEAPSMSTPESTSSQTPTPTRMPAPVPTPTGTTTGVSALAGEWDYQGEHPTDVASLTVEPDGSTSYIAEGLPYTYTGEAVPVDEDEFTMKLYGTEPDGTVHEDEVQRIRVNLGKQGEELTAQVGDYEQTFIRSS